MKLFKNDTKKYTDDTFRDQFSNSPDVHFKTIFSSTTNRPVKMLIFFAPSLVNMAELNDHILEDLEKIIYIEEDKNKQRDDSFTNTLMDFRSIPFDGNSESLYQFIFGGEVLIFIEEKQQLYSIAVPQVPNRQPEESAFEVSVRGPRDGFIEDVSVNVALIRKRLRTSTLTVKEFIVGKRSQTKVALLYMDDIIEPSLVTTVTAKINELNIDILTSSQQLQELISEYTFNLFPLTDYTSRPDYCVECLNQGRFILIIDGQPTVIVAPTTLLLQVKTAEDSNLPFFYVSFERILRIGGFFLSILIPGFWVALSTVNIEQIPFTLLATISVSRLGLPLSATMEMFLMLALFELFRESGVRLPKAVGQTVAVVGGLIVGDAAIRAGLTSPTMLVVAAITSVASFTLVNQALTGAVTVLRFAILLLSSVLGVYGLIIGFIITTALLSSLESFGIPYMNDFSPATLHKMVVSFLKKPWKRAGKRNESTIDQTRKGGQT